MTQDSESAVNQPEQINLKHRITGAGVLIFFGALVLPWLLGPPSEAQKGNVDVANANQTSKTQLHSTFEDEVLAELQGVDSDFVEAEDTVYVSKITPVSSEPSEPERVDKPKTKAIQSSKTETKKESVAVKEPAKKQEVSKKEASKKEADKQAKTEVKKEPAKTVAKKEPKKQPKPDASSSTKSTKEVASSSNKVDVGWVVQVELLTDKDGAQRLVKDLENKGLKAKTTVVDTNRGKNTGTRIWLGPFESRTMAAAENDRLESKMGKRGFIRVYP